MKVGLMKLLLPFTLCLSALAMALGFSMCTNTPSPADGGLEADVPADTVRDNGWIAADIAEADAPHDGGPQDPEWVPLPGLPGGCTIERAMHPERITTIEWVSCGEGCEYLGPDTRYQRAMRTDSGSYHEGTGYFGLVQALPSDERAMIIIADTAGRIYGAWREEFDSSRDGFLCVLRGPATGDGFGAFGITISNRAMGVRETHIFVDRVNDIGQRETATAILGGEMVPTGAVLQRHRVSSSLYVAELRPGGNLILVQPDGQFEKQSVGAAQHPNVVGDDVIFEAAREEDGVLYRTMMHTRFGEEPTVLLDAADGHIAGARATADGLTWSYARTAGGLGETEHIELWTSPFATERDSLEPRMVRNLVPELNEHYTVQQGAGDGFWVGRAELTHYIRLSDGETFYAPHRTEGPSGTNGYLWLAGGEIAIAGTLTGLGISQGSLVRYQVDALRPTSDFAGR